MPPQRHLRGDVDLLAISGGKGHDGPHRPGLSLGVNTQKARPLNPENQGAARSDVGRPRSESCDRSHGGFAHQNWLICARYPPEPSAQPGIQSRRSGCLRMSQRPAPASADYRIDDCGLDPSMTHEHAQTGITMPRACALLMQSGRFGKSASRTSQSTPNWTQHKPLRHALPHEPDGHRRPERY